MGHDWHGVVRDLLVVLLTLTTGAVDATCFLHLGSVFSSVITGNLVLLGVAAGTLQPSLAAHSGMALAGYSAGVVIGAPVAARRSEHARTWPPSVTVTLVVEICVLALFSVGWELTGGNPGRTVQLVLVAALAAAMGIQSAAVRHLGEMSTTYLTGTLTGVIAGLTTRNRQEGFRRSVAVLAAIVVGATIGAVVARQGPAWTPVVIMAPVTAVVIGAVVGFEPVKVHPGPRRAR